MLNYEFYVMADGAYPHVPHARKRTSNFIDLPSSHYDPLLGQRTIEDQLNALIAAEDLGFDGALVSEQHNGPIGLLGNPMVAGAYLAARTKRMRIVVTGPLLNAYLTPIRLAEEVALLDTLSRGRLSLGLPMGHGMQYHSLGVMNPAKARARFLEGHDLLMKALTETTPFEWNGDFFNIPYVNLWPKPVQKPVPPIFIPGAGSPETLQFAAKHRYNYQPVLSPRSVLLKNVKKFRELCQEEGYDSDPNQVVRVVCIHVAETDKQARLETEAHDLWQYQNFLHSSAMDTFPPGYMSPQSLKGMVMSGFLDQIGEVDYDFLQNEGWLVAGSPDTVASRLKELAEEFGSGRMVVMPTTGTKPHWLVMKTLTLFAEEVIPQLRKGGAPHYAQSPAYQTNAEFAARRPRNAPVPETALGDGHLYNAAISHIEDLRIPLEPWPPTQG